MHHILSDERWNLDASHEEKPVESDGDKDRDSAKNEIPHAAGMSRTIILATIPFNKICDKHKNQNKCYGNNDIIDVG